MNNTKNKFRKKAFLGIAIVLAIVILTFSSNSLAKELGTTSPTFSSNFLTNSSVFINSEWIFDKENNKDILLKQQEKEVSKNNYSNKNWRGTPLGAAGSIWYPGRESEIKPIIIKQITEEKEASSTDIVAYNKILNEETSNLSSIDIVDITPQKTENITILNPKSCPLVEENWTVRFKTKGIGNLTIRAVDGTFFNRNIEFLGLYCGDKKIEAKTFFSNKDIYDTWYASNDSGYLTVENFLCNEESKLILREIETGSHTLEFKFRDQIAYAYNLADCDGGGVGCHCCDVSAMNVRVTSPSGSTTQWYTMSYSAESGSCTCPYGTDCSSDPSKYINESWIYNLGYTFCPEEGSYTAHLNASSAGGGSTCATYSWENQSGMSLYSVYYDNDQNWCQCKMGSGYWNLGGEVAPTTCCGDDTGEYKKTCVDSSDQGACGA
ncbi:MAG: hypothetical protein QXY62_03025, partial [Candidatus Altiarchaeota archaeon]